MFQFSETSLNKLLTKPTKEKEFFLSSYLPKNYAAKSTCRLGRLEGLLLQENVCSQIIGINPVNLVEGQLTHLHGEKNDELCGVGWIGSEGELVWCSFQQPLQQIARSFCINKT